MKPGELWALSACEFIDMHEARIEANNEEFDTEMQRTSWFTSLLMNSSGNYKKQIKPEKLYTPLSKQETEQNVVHKKEYVDNQRDELARKFNL